MKYKKIAIIGWIFVALLSGCAKDAIIEDIENKSNQSNLLTLSIEYKNSIFDCEILNNSIILKRALPYGANEVAIHSITTSPGAISNKKKGEKLLVNNQPIPLVITAENKASNQQYTLNLRTKKYASIVQENGLLQVNGNKIVNKNSIPISLAGNSFFWTNNNWNGFRFYNASVVSWLKLDWSAKIVRAAMGVEDAGGYLEDKTSNKARVKRIVDAAIKEGIYVIIDWHSHHAEDNVDEAILFFKEMAELYGQYNNIIYEIYNEPLDVSWENTIKPYATSVISAIRAIDSDNLIVVGTPEWSQRVDLAAENPITGFNNIAYTLHFYSVNHKQWLRDRAKKALDKGIALFVTEWGALGYTQEDPETEKWMTWCKENSISHCNWAVNNKKEEWSIIKEGASESGSWKDNNLTDAGWLTRSIIRNWND
ncbi:glycoside hydrolase family 5 protein [Polaribacter batillariae]|uniref:Glycoside hydrolase family 5 protein n=1 Tax=Polaribacter batillariae TaxID=2808900 RepID=A0ABX7SW65_9FLAO|nr:glycoside hydrolase family 5 protein [Polaribacter batillariae]QTD38500.1 glycoside hydrolase family 5 protein [Polaribacter batillariae]